MKLKSFKQRNLKKIFIIVFSIIGVFLMAKAIFSTSFASYEDNKSFNIVSTTIPDIGEALYVYHLNDGTITTLARDFTGLVLDQARSSCNYNVIPSWDSETQQITLDKTNMVNTENHKIRCEIYFTEKIESIDTVHYLQSFTNTIKINTSMNNQTGTCPTYDATNKWIVTTAGEQSSSLLCEAEDDYGDSYYFRGNVTNNYVKFAGFIWRIIRINGDGTIKIIYDGTEAYDNNANGESTSNGTKRQIGTSTFSSTSNDNCYLGYMYKSCDASSYKDTFEVMNNKSANSSTIKGSQTAQGTIDYWYSQNIDIEVSPGSTKKFSDFVSLDTIFCNDKNPSNTVLSGYTNLGYKKERTTYRWRFGPSDSGNNKQYPRFFCLNKQTGMDSKNDAFTVSDKGNGALTYPVGLISSDELVSAGAWNTTQSHYLRTGAAYWTMSPSYFYSNLALMKNVYTNGAWNNDSYVNASNGVRPVLSLLSSTKFATGSLGTKEKPFEVVYE